MGLRAERGLLSWGRYYGALRKGEPINLWERHDRLDFHQECGIRET